LTKHKVIDLFAGCGGLTQGFVDGGFAPVLAVELDHHAAATYAANFDPDLVHTFCGDIAELSSRDVPEADVVIGGPPCQGFSGLGLQDKNDPRNKLWTEYVRVVKASNADVFVIENVDRFLKSGEFSRLKFEVDEGELRDFEIEAAVLNSADYGVPQKRRRTIIIGSRIGKLLLPVATHSNQPQLDTEPWRSVRHALDGVPFTERAPNSLPKRSEVVFDQSIPGPFSMEELHFGRSPTQLSLDRYAVIPPGGGRHDLARERPDLLPPCWKKKPTGTSDVMGRMEWDKPSVTIRTEFYKPEKGKYLHPEWHRTKASKRVDRSITHREAALLQTFPSHFVWCGSKTQIARQIGNAVPPVLAYAIAESVKQQLSLAKELAA